VLMLLVLLLFVRRMVRGRWLERAEAMEKG
jgi:hypothetical protein